VKFLAAEEMASAPRVVWASACHASDPTSSIAAVAVKAIAILRIAVLLDVRPSLPGTMVIEDACLFNVGTDMNRRRKTEFGGCNFQNVC
jgi:hypothetical protein